MKFCVFVCICVRVCVCVRVCCLLLMGVDIVKLRVGTQKLFLILYYCHYTHQL